MLLHFRLFFFWTVAMMSSRQEYASRCNDPFPFLETYMTVNVRPVSGILKELYDIQHDSENTIWSNGSNTSQYWLSSLLYAHIMIRMAEDVPRTCDAVTATELYTVITGEAAQGLRPTPPLSRTNWSFNHWGLFFFSFFCVRVLRLDPLFGFQIDCVRLHSFACDLIFLLSTAEQSSAGVLKGKKCVRTFLSILFSFFFVWHLTT